MDQGNQGGGEEFEIVEYDEMVGEEEEDENEDLDETNSEYESAEESEELLEGKRVTFDISLPSAHSYLSDDWDELSGRTLHEDGTVLSLPVLSFPGVVLMPGQLLPLHLFRNADIAMIKYCLDRDRTFGQLNLLSVPRQGSEGYMQTLASVGTTVEILAVKEEEGLDMKVKTVGRQRFEVLNRRSDVGGNILATVRILCDKSLSELLPTLHHPTPYPYLRIEPYLPHSGGGDDDTLNKNNNVDISDKNVATNGVGVNHGNSVNERVQQGHNEEAAHNITHTSNAATRSDDDDDDHPQYNLHNNNVTLGDSRHDDDTSRYALDDVGDDVTHHEPNSQDTQVNKILSCKRIVRLHSTALLTHWPEWVYKQYNCGLLMRDIRHEMGSWNDKMLSCKVPQDAESFSFWVASCLPLEDAMRLELLRMDSCQQRLRSELHLIKKCTVMCCNRCKQMVARKQDVFSMSSVGPLATYVNPGGHVHDTLTVHHVTGLRHVGKPSTEASWFPGYAWTIVECQTCHKHMGWRFTEASRDASVQPQRFWGLCRTGLVPGLIDPDEPVQSFVGRGDL